MSYSIDICLVCLKHSKNLILIRSPDTNEESIENKLKYFLPEQEFSSNIQEYICIKCENELNKIYKLKQKWLQNVKAYKKYAQEAIAVDGPLDGPFKHLFVTIRPDFVHQQDTSDENNHNSNNLKSKNEIDLDIVVSEIINIKEEMNDELVLHNRLESVPRDIKEENFQSAEPCLNFVYEEAEVSHGSDFSTNILKSPTEMDTDIVNRQELIIKEEANERLVLDDELKSLINNIKQENPESEDIYNKNKNIIGENVHMPNDSASFSTENENIGEQEKQEYYECYVCHKTYLTKVELKNHISLHSTQQESRNCDKNLNTVNDIKKHELKNNDGKLCKCIIWNESFKCSHTLEKQKHIIRAAMKSFTCEVCNKSFLQLSILKKHKLVHTSEKPFTCQVCNKSFRHSTTLKQHKLIHSDERPYVCEVCTKSFRQFAALKSHKLRHTDEKPFTCELCNKSFRHPHTLKEHKFIHTGEKPFTCKVCNKSFRHLQTLNRHKLTHTDKKPFSVKLTTNRSNSLQL